MWMRLTSRLIAQASTHGFRTDPSMSVAEAVAKVIEAGLPHDGDYTAIDPYIPTALAATKAFPGRRRDLPVSTEYAARITGLRRHVGSLDELTDKRRATTIAAEAAGWRGLDVLYRQKAPEQTAVKVQEDTDTPSENYREWLEAELKRVSSD